MISIVARLLNARKSRKTLFLGKGMIHQLSKARMPMVFSTTFLKKLEMYMNA
jgi:hypothetical protein